MVKENAKFKIDENWSFKWIQLSTCYQTTGKRYLQKIQQLISILFKTSSYKKQLNTFHSKANYERTLPDITSIQHSYTNFKKVFWEYVLGFDFAVEKY